MNKRYIGAVIYLIPTVILIFMGGSVLKYGLMVLSLIGLTELYDAFSKKGINAFKWIGYIATIIYYILLGREDVDMVTLGFLVTVVMIALLIAPMVIKGRGILDSACTLFGGFYVTGFMSLIYLIGNKPFGIILIWLIFISSWSCDTAAYFIGKNFGRGKIAPLISPNKTFEGSAAGLVATIICCVAYGYIVNRYFKVNIDLFHFFVIGVLCGILNQIGDLTASFIKRNMEIKDFSNLIPGHGGILDRFDSILFASAVIYYYISIIL